MLALLLVTQALAADPAVDSQVWIGHQRTVGVRKVPILGNIKTVTDVYVVSKTQDDGGQITFVETPCQIHIKSQGGVRLEFAPDGVRNIPPPTIRFVQTSDKLVAEPWTGGWGQDDVDQDGAPGFRVAVHAPVCSGSLSIGSRTSSNATAVRQEDGSLLGEVRSVIHREVLDWSNACLGLVPRKQDEGATGTFRYVRAEPTATCETAKFPDL
jgi:hypothetical protein